MENDLISRSALRETMCGNLKRVAAGAHFKLRNDAYRMERAIMEAIDAAPAVDAEPVRHGCWMAFDDGYQAGFEAAQPKWISVADRKPTETGSYIVCTNRNAVCAARYYAQTTFGGTVQNGYFAGKVGNHITHWMNLPEPPKGDQDD